ncbi:MAG TPA: hypothetical protein VIX19_07560 [Terriglobales bacterium]
MRVFSSMRTAFAAVRPRLVWHLFATPLLFLFNTPPAQAGATLFLEEPYSYDGTLAGTGHAAIYLDHVCAASPVELRVCKPGETGIVLSRYHEIGGYDWIAIPLVPYLYAVERQEDVPLYANAKLVAFLRDQYRRKYLESLVPDRPGGGAPAGEWYELIGASYIRTIYAFAIESSPEQDALLINKFNSQRNHRGFNLVTHNCADFAREVIDFYFPHAVHRNVIFDLGVTTPKQIAKMLAKYSRRHPELESSSFVIPQVPGAIPRSKPVRGVLELALSAKKYVVPMLLLHPYISGGVLAVYFGRPRFNPAQHALVLDSRWQLDTPMTSAERRSFLSELDELKQMSSVQDSSSDSSVVGKTWEQLQAGAEPGLDSSGTPVVQVRIGGDVANVGISRANVLSGPGSSDLAAKLLAARIQQELRPAMARKAAHSEVASDLALLRQLLSVKLQTGLAGIFPSPDESINHYRTQAASDVRP